MNGVKCTQTVGRKSQYYSSEMLMCGSDEHFTVLSHRREFVNGKKAMQLMLIGHMTMTRCPLKYVWIKFILHTIIEQTFYGP